MKLHKLIAGFFSQVSCLAVRRPGTALALTALITLAAAPGILRLKLRTDGRALVPPDAPEVQFANSIRDEFGIQDQLVVLIRSPHPDGIFNPETLQLVRDLTADFRDLPGINPSNVLSLATEPSFRMRPGSITPQRLLEPPLRSPLELGQLREDLRRIELYTGTLVSDDAKSTAILIGTPPGGDRTQLYERVMAIVAKAGQTGRLPPGRLALGPNAGATPAAAGGTRALLSADDITVTGAPVAESLLGIHILEDLGVPSKLLGATTRARAAQAEWSLPANLHQLRQFIARRIGLVPVAILVMVLVFLLAFRNPLATLVPLPGVVATLLFVFGLMGWAGVPIYLTIAVMPVLLTATGVTNDIYVFTRYFTLLREQSDISHLELLRQTFDKLASPIAITSLTTAIGFFSFAFSPLGPVQAFGLCSGIGVLFGLFYSLIAVPAMLALIPPAWLLSGRRRETSLSALAKRFTALGGGVVRFRWAVLTLALFLAALTPLGLRRLVVQDSWTDAFAPESEFRRATRMVNDHFHGMHLLLVCLDASQLLTGELPAPPNAASQIILPGNLCKELSELEGAAITLSCATTNAAAPRLWRSQLELLRRAGTNIIAWVVPTPDSADFPRDGAGGTVHFELAARAQLKPKVVAAHRDLAAFLRERSRYAVGGVLGPYEFLATTRFMSHPNDPNARQLLSLASENRVLWDYYGMALGPHRLRQVMDTNFWRSLTTVFLKDANFVDTANLMTDLRAYEREHLAPTGYKLGFAGDVALSQALIRGIVTTQLQSLCWSLAGVYLVTAVLGGSWRWGLYAVLPSLLAVLLKLAIMGWLSVPLGVATSMFAAMTFGIGVNCAIQLLEAFGHAQGGGASRLEALRAAMASTGPAALINTVAVSLGFAVLMLSQVPANARLGLLMVLGLLECFVASLLLLPVLLHWWPLKDARATSKP
jgi:predicted RND superfamily exporter protein